jgi:hypothetical protein
VVDSAPERGGAQKALLAGCVMLLLASKAGCAPAAENPARTDAFGDAVAAAQANLRTPEGQRYDAALAKYAAAHHGALMDGCFFATKQPDRAPFRLVLQVRTDGTIETARARPETNLAACFRDKLKGSRLPPPPAADYWVLVDMTVDAK